MFYLEQHQTPQYGAPLHGNNTATGQLYPPNSVKSYSSVAKQKQPNIQHIPRMNNQQQQQKAFPPNNPHLSGEPVENSLQHGPRVVTQEQLDKAKQQYWEKPKECNQAVTTTTPQSFTQTSANKVSGATCTVQTSVTPIVTSTTPSSAHFMGNPPSTATQSNRQLSSSNRVTSPGDAHQTGSPVRVNSLEQKGLPEQKPDIITDLPSKERRDLVKFGKVNKTDDGKF